MSLNRDAVVKLLKEAAKAGATEVHFKVPSRPLMRVDNALTQTSLPPVTPRDAQEAVFALCSLAQKELPVATITDGSGSPRPRQRSACSSMLAESSHSTNRAGQWVMSASVTPPPLPDALAASAMTA